MKQTKTLKTKVQDVNEAKGIVTIQITQFDKYDSDNDRLMKGALNKTWSEFDQVHLIDHKMGINNYVGLAVRKDSESGIIESCDLSPLSGGSDQKSFSKNTLCRSY